MPEMSRKEVIRILTAMSECSATDKHGTPYYDEEEKQVFSQAASDLEMMERVETGRIDLKLKIFELIEELRYNKNAGIIEGMTNCALRISNLCNAKFAERLLGIEETVSIALEDLVKRNGFNKIPNHMAIYTEEISTEIAKAVITYLTSEEK